MLNNNIKRKSLQCFLANNVLFLQLSFGKKICHGKYCCWCCHKQNKGKWTLCQCSLCIAIATIFACFYRLLLYFLGVKKSFQGKNWTFLQKIFRLASIFVEMAAVPPLWFRERDMPTALFPSFVSNDTNTENVSWFLAPKVLKIFLWNIHTGFFKVKQIVDGRNYSLWNWRKVFIYLFMLFGGFFSRFLRNNRSLT